MANTKCLLYQTVFKGPSQEHRSTKKKQFVHVCFGGAFTFTDPRALWSPSLDSGSL